MMVTQEFTYPCQVIILFHSEELILIPVGINRHTSELQDIEGLPFSSYSFLLEDDRIAILSLDHQIDDEEEWGEDDETSQGDDTVERSFHPLEIVFFECIHTEAEGVEGRLYLVDLFVLRLYLIDLTDTTELVR